MLNPLADGAGHTLTAGAAISPKTLLSGMLWATFLEPVGRLCPVMLELPCRDRGVGVRRSGQAELTLSCELALLSGRPCDYPVCAASAYP